MKHRQRLICLGKTLPKYKIMSDKEDESDIPSNTNMYFNTTPSMGRKIESISYDSLKEWFEKNNDNVTNFNITLSDKMRNNLELSVMDASSSGIVFGSSIRTDDKKPNFLVFIINYFKENAINVRLRI